MIIEAGYDLHQVIYPSLYRSTKSRRALWLMALDEDLRYLYTRRVVPDLNAPINELVPEILKTLRVKKLPWTPRYFALAHSMPSLPHEGSDVLYEEDRGVEDAPQLAGYHYLGRLVTAGGWCTQTWPRYSFRDYPGHWDLPRVVAIPGPHEFDCTCAACTQHEARLVARRARNASAVETPLPIVATP